MHSLLLVHFAGVWTQGEPGTVWQAIGKTGRLIPAEPDRRREEGEQRSFWEGVRTQDRAEARRPSLSDPASAPTLLCSVKVKVQSEEELESLGPSARRGRGFVRAGAGLAL